MKCRHCGTQLEHLFVDLGCSPPSNAYLSAEDLQRPETYFPLRVFVCSRCFLVQTEDFSDRTTLFRDDYAYFSSTSRSWVDHAASYVRAITSRLSLKADSFVLEVAANDGYLLRNFVDAGIPCLGIEPTASTAEAAMRLGVPILQEFFGEELGRRLTGEGRAADLIVGNNVFAHVPDINDFTLGLHAALKPEGVVTLEFPHVMRLIEFCQFDTIYHEHFSYLSLLAVTAIFAHAGLRVFDVEELPTHGGSLRVYGCRRDASHGETPAVAELRRLEASQRLDQLTAYQAFQQRAEALKDGFVRFLLDRKQAGETVAGYGAAAKGNTLLNFAGIRPGLLPFVCDAAPAKQGKFLPGSRIPVLSPEVLALRRPDYLVILPWNIAAEVMEQNAALAAQGTRFVTAVPEIRVE